MSDEPTTGTEETSDLPWYKQVTRYQWTVLIIACLGWIFDIFEAQIFVTSMNEAMPALMPKATEAAINLYNNLAFGAFLVGGAVGGVLFGMVSDRIGRTRTMILTILMYAVFASTTAFVQSAWQMIVLRFLVGMGTGGEWAVAGAMVAEVFPKVARARSLGIFHASSSIGSFLAIAAGAFVVGNQYLDNIGWNWRIGFALGALPALLVLWIRWKLHEPEQWVAAKEAGDQDESKRTGRIRDLFGREVIRRTLIGMVLAAVGLATYWGVRVHGLSVMRIAHQQQIVQAAGPDTAAERQAVIEQHSVTIQQWGMLGYFLVTVGGFIGLLSFGPICERIGRRGAFLFFHIGGFIAGIVMFWLLPLTTAYWFWGALLLFGYLVTGMHAGYAIYFPELFPTRLRGTGGGFCFNFGRIVATPTLLFAGLMQTELGFTLQQSAVVLSFLFLIGGAVILIAPETRGQDLPE